MNSGFDQVSRLNPRSIAKGRKSKKDVGSTPAGSGLDLLEKS